MILHSYILSVQSLIESSNPFTSLPLFTPDTLNDHQCCRGHSQVFFFFQIFFICNNYTWNNIRKSISPMTCFPSHKFCGTSIHNIAIEIGFSKRKVPLKLEWTEKENESIGTPQVSSHSLWLLTMF